MKINNVKINKSFVSIAQLKKQVEPAICDGFHCFKVNTAIKNFVLSKGGIYPEAIQVQGQKFKLWINAITDDFYYVSPEHQEYIDEMMAIYAYDCAKDDGELF